VVWTRGRVFTHAEACGRVGPRPNASPRYPQRSARFGGFHRHRKRVPSRADRGSGPEEAAAAAAAVSSALFFHRASSSERLRRLQSDASHDYPPGSVGSLAPVEPRPLATAASRPPPPRCPDSAVCFDGDFGTPLVETSPYSTRYRRLAQGDRPRVRPAQWPPPSRGRLSPSFAGALAPSDAPAPRRHGRRDGRR